MKNFCFLLFLLVWMTSSAQLVVRGKLTDRQTNEPVIAASIGIKGKASGTISNEEGVFQLSVAADDQIMVSCLGYQPMVIPAHDFSADAKNIFLEPSEEKLEEVMVVNVPLHELLREAVAVSTARLNKPIHLQTYYREFVKTNGKYSNFADGLVDYHVTGNTKKTNADVVVLQNRSVNLISPDEDDEGVFALLKVENGATGGYRFHYLDAVLDKGKFDDYEFQLKSRTDKQGTELYVIYFEPKSAIEKPLYQGTVTFDPKTKLVQEASIGMADSHKQYAKTVNVLLARLSVMDVNFKVSYKTVGDNYVLSYNNRYAKLRIWNKKHDYLLESRSDLIVTDFGIDKGYDKKSVFKKKYLYERPTSFATKFWQQSNAIVLTSDEQRIIDELEKHAHVN